MPDLSCQPLSPEIKEAFDKWFDKHAEKVKKETGFDYHNHTQEEWNAYYLSIAEKQAESDEYFREILKSAKRIIDEKDYSGLVRIYENYDKLVKEQYDKVSQEAGISPERKWADLELPYWCYCNYAVLPKTNNKGETS